MILKFPTMKLVTKADNKEKLYFVRYLFLKKLDSVKNSNPKGLVLYGIRKYEKFFMQVKF